MGLVGKALGIAIMASLVAWTFVNFVSLDLYKTWSIIIIVAIAAIIEAKYNLIGRFIPF